MPQEVKNKLFAVACFFAGVAVTIIGFHLKPKGTVSESPEEAEPEPTVSMVDEETMREHASFDLPMIASGRCEEIPMSSIPVGSWWTDGDVYFKVISNDADTLYMLGTNLSDPGMELTFVKQDFYMRTYGSSVFAMYDSPALIYELKLADGSVTQFIVSYYDEEWMRPQSILQRYHGKGLEKQ